MIDLGLTTSEKGAFHRMLARSGRVRLTVVITGRDENVIGSLTAPVNQVVSGSVQVDNTVDIHRRLEMHVLDPTGKLVLDPASPSVSSLWPSYFIGVTWSKYVSNDAIYPSMNRWVDVPVFFGPLTKFSRTGPDVTLEAMGKEMLGLDPYNAWATINIKDGRKLTDAIKDVMNPQGETKYAFPEIPSVTVGASTLLKGSSPWKKAKTMASNHGPRQLIYDGRGYAKLRMYPSKSSWTFRKADIHDPPSAEAIPTVVSEPTLTYSFDDLRNTVWVQGPVPASGTRIEYTAFPGPDHPLSPSMMARNGKPRYIIEHIVNEELKTADGAKTQAQNVLDNLLRATTSAEFDCLPVPMLEEGDVVTLVSPGLPEVQFVLRKWTLPLTEGETMSVGYDRRVASPKGMHPKRM